MSDGLLKLAHLALTAQNDAQELVEAEMTLDDVRRDGQKPHPLAVKRVAKAQKSLDETIRDLHKAATTEVLLAAVARILALETQVEKLQSKGGQA